jgi:subtilase family serine protease
MKKRTLAALVAGATTLLVSTVVVASPTSAATNRSIPNTLPAWLAHATHLGDVATASQVSGDVYLAPRGGLAALGQLATEMATPGTAAYHQFLTGAEYQARFAPTALTVQAVTRYLVTSGLAVTDVGAGNGYVSFTGTAAAAQKAFSTRLERYRHDGADVQAPDSTLSVPADLADTILTVDGLDTTPHIAKPAGIVSPDSPVPAGFRNARPCSVFYGQVQATYQADFTTPLPTFDGQTLAYAPCGYTGPQMRAAYEGNTTLSGAGVTVAITDAYAASTMAKDAETYADRNGDGSYAKGQFVQTKPGATTHQKACDPSGWAGEETLDVEAVHAMAPSANIHYYGANSCEDADLLKALNKVVNDDTAQLVTNSWGDVESATSASLVASYESVFLHGAVEGMSFMYSSGDDGDELANTGVKQADYPTSDPYVTSVGGTSTGIDGSGNLAFQTGWGTEKYSLSANGTAWDLSTAFLYGSGGGTSGLFNQPSYQAGIAPAGHRDVPDVAMNADPNTGMLVGETQKFGKKTLYDQYRIGGTSLASPLFAGMTALAIQANGGHGVGLLNPVIYANPSAFTDVVEPPAALGDVRVDFANGVDASDGLLYSVRTFDQDSSLTVGPGWDDVTGLGSPNSAWLSAVH